MWAGRPKPPGSPDALDLRYGLMRTQKVSVACAAGASAPSVALTVPALALAGALTVPWLTVAAQPRAVDEIVVPEGDASESTRPETAAVPSLIAVMRYLMQAPGTAPAPISACE